MIASFHKGMENELAEFVGREDAQASAEGRSRPTVLRDLLIFEYLGDLYGVPAPCVDGVIPWKSPARVPGADSRVKGVIQDRGRIVVVMVHPTGRADHDASKQGKRIVICSTSRGRVGLPATTTSAVGPVELVAEPTPFAVHDSKLGPFTYLDPTLYVEGQS